jgi:hypothetical protein
MKNIFQSNLENEHFLFKIKTKRSGKKTFFKKPARVKDSDPPSFNPGGLPKRQLQEKRFLKRSNHETAIFSEFLFDNGGSADQYHLR